MTAKRRTRRTLTMVVTVTVPHWCSVTNARQAVRDQINDSYFEYNLLSPEGESGRIRAKSVSSVRL